MIEIAHTASYDRPAAAVFATLTDVAGYPAWQPTVVSADVAGGREVGAGAEIREVCEVMGRRFEIVLTVTGYRPGELLALRTAPGARPEISQTYRLRPEGAGCRLDYRLTVDGVPRLVERLARAQIDRQAPGMLERLGAVDAP